MNEQEVRLILETVWDAGYYAGIYKNKDCRKLNIDNMLASMKSLEPKVDDKEIEKILKTATLGYHYPIDEKGKPIPEPRPLYLHDYRIDAGGLRNLATAIVEYLKRGRK